jgi:hypothetical protein
MAPPSAALDAKLNETVIAGNWPWWAIESGSVAVAKCEIAPSGTAPFVVELVLPADVLPLLEVAVLVLEVKAFTGGFSVSAVGVYMAVVVRALEPADVEPLPLELAAAPLVPWAEFERM